MDPPVGHVTFLDHQGSQLDPPFGHVTVSWPIAVTAVILRRWQCQVNLLHIFEFYLKYLSNTTFRHPFDSLVTGMSWPDDPVIVIQNVNFSTQKGNEKQPEQEALHDELKLCNPGVHISNLGARDQRSICRTGCLGAGQRFATQLRKINMLS